MVRMRSKNAISIPGQISRLENDFPKGCVIFRSPRNFKWEMDIQPTPNSRIYRIRIRYTIGDRPKVYVINTPFLEKAEGYSLLLRNPDHGRPVNPFKIPLKRYSFTY